MSEGWDGPDTAGERLRGPWAGRGPGAAPEVWPHGNEEKLHVVIILVINPQPKPFLPLIFRESARRGCKRETSM